MMSDVALNIKVRGPDLGKWLDPVAKKQIPYAMSVALNKLGRMVGAEMATIAGQKFRVRAAWSRRYRTGSIGAGEQYITDAAAFFNTQVSKNVPVAQMAIKIATPSWQMAQQSDDTSSARTPEYVQVQSESGKPIYYIAIPVQANVKYMTNGKLRPNAQHMLNYPAQTRSFVITTNNGHKVLFQRFGNAKEDIRAMYMLVDSVTVTPKFNFARVAEDTINRLFDDLFDQAMTQAMATAKKV